MFTLVLCRPALVRGDGGAENYTGVGWTGRAMELSNKLHQDQCVVK